MKHCPGAVQMEMAALLWATLAPLAPSPLSAQTRAFRHPTGASLEPRVVYLGTFAVEGTASWEPPAWR